MNGSAASAARPGSTIGVVTPGSPPETRAEVQRAIAWWEPDLDGVDADALTLTIDEPALLAP